MYSVADIYLLVDPLSTVDAEVGNQIFQQCVKEQLRGKTIVLATHQVQYLPKADKVLVLDSGRVIFYGTYDQLTENNVLRDRLCDFTTTKYGEYTKELSLLVDYNKSTEIPSLASTDITEASIKWGSYYRYFKFEFKNAVQMTIALLLLCLGSILGPATYYWASTGPSNPSNPCPIEILGLITLISCINLSHANFYAG